MCGCGGPPYGVPIPPELHEQYSDELKSAWDLFASWMKGSLRKGSVPIDRKTMPTPVKEAMELILKTRIPGYPDGVTGADSCFMVESMHYLSPEEESEEKTE